MSSLVLRMYLAAALLVTLTARLAVGATLWSRDTFLANVQQLAAQADLRDAQEMGRRLGADLGLRPYCADAQCSPNKVLGMARAFPDPPLTLPGDGGVSAQYYAPDRADPPGSDLPLIGTLAVLDLFPDRGGFCLHRSDVRAALGPEAFQGSQLNRGEPLDIALNYVAFSGAEYRTIISLVFAGPISDDGCLALASVRQDNFGLDRNAAARRKAFNVLSRPATESPYFDEDPVDLAAHRDALDPAGVDTSPLGLTLREFAARFPQCKLGAPAATEEGGILTAVPPPLIPLLPTLNDAYLATGHSIRDTGSHGAPLAAAIDPVLLVTHEAACFAPKPLEHATPWDAFNNQKFGILTFEGRIAVLFKASAQSWHTYAPAGILAAEALAPAPGTSATLVEGVDAYAAQVVLKIAREPRPVVVGFLANQNIGTLVKALSPHQMRQSQFLSWSNTAYAFIDMSLWRSYSERVRSKLQTLRDGKPAGLAEVCTPSTCPFPPPEDPVPRHQPDAAMQLLRLAQALAAAGDLTDYGTFEPATGGKALLLRNGIVQDTVDQSARDWFTVGLAPGTTALDGFGFQYLIIPDGYGDTRPRLSAYHREVAHVSLGNGRYGVGRDACITRDMVLAAFGPNQMQDRTNGPSNKFAYKFDLTQARGHTIYVTVWFYDPNYHYSSDIYTRCAGGLDLQQYRLVQPQ